MESNPAPAKWQTFWGVNARSQKQNQVELRSRFEQGGRPELSFPILPPSHISYMVSVDAKHYERRSRTSCLPADVFLSVCVSSGMT